MEGDTTAMEDWSIEQIEVEITKLEKILPIDKAKIGND
jgi:hypothetical protein